MKKRRAAALLLVALICLAASSCSRPGRDDDPSEAGEPKYTGVVFEPEDIVSAPEEPEEDMFFSVIDGSLAQRTSAGWGKLSIYGVAVSPDELVKDPERSVYKDFFFEAKRMGANCVVASGLMQPEFYLELYSFDLQNPTEPLYLIQTICGTDDAQGLSSAAVRAVDAVHGEGEGFSADLSNRTVGYLIDADAQTASGAAEALSKYEAERYFMLTPTGYGDDGSAAVNAAGVFYILDSSPDFVARSDRAVIARASLEGRENFDLLKKTVPEQGYDGAVVAY